LLTSNLTSETFAGPPFRGFTFTGVKRPSNTRAALAPLDPQPG